MNYLGKQFNSLFSDSFYIDYNGIKLPHSSISLINSKMQILCNKTPSSSVIKLSFYPFEHHIHARIEIKDRKNYFSSIVTGRDPIQIYHRLEENISFQLEEWKRKRFTFKSNLKPLPINYEISEAL